MAMSVFLLLYLALNVARRPAVTLARAGFASLFELYALQHPTLPFPSQSEIEIGANERAEYVLGINIRFDSKSVVAQRCHIRIGVPWKLS